MTELKTLKDFLKGRTFIENNEDRETITFGELRAEAVKWIKSFKKEIELTRNEGAGAQMFGAIEFIKHFFNITEEELAK